ncbi:hypothetical protein CL634_05285 [bacterium]|nr:hypothetical protein [bacterium]|tara:strand:+ start:286 stop:1059 length:774 start_codon:yes stop_codon:yes gene_type:complete
MENVEIKQFILQLSAEAGEFLRNHFYTYKNVYQADVGAYVTNIDLELEETMRRRIKEKFPEHEVVIVGGKDNPSEVGANRWVIDPLDGSSHFARGVPIYTTTIAFQKDGQTKYAAVNHPQTNQLYFAEQGKGAKLNGTSIKVSKTNKLAKSYVYLELPEKKFADQPSGEFKKSMSKVDELIASAGQVETFRIGSAGMCLVASGSFDAYVDMSGSSTALGQLAASFILREAGGEITDLKPADNGFVQVVGTNGKLKVF